jgi:hypothetical protein
MVLLLALKLKAPKKYKKHGLIKKKVPNIDCHHAFNSLQNIKSQKNCKQVLNLFHKPQETKEGSKS